MAWIAALVAAAGSTYASLSSQAKARQNARNQSALSNMPGGGSGGGGFQPTALSARAQPPNTENKFELGLKDLLKDEQPKEQQFSLGSPSAAFSPDAKPSAIGDSGTMFAGNELSNMQQQPDQQKPADSAPTDYGQYLELAQAAGQIGQQIGQGPPAPPGFMPSPGNMNFQPTALSILARRRGF